MEQSTEESIYIFYIYLYLSILSSDASKSLKLRTYSLGAVLGAM